MIQESSIKTADFAAKFKNHYEFDHLVLNCPRLIIYSITDIRQKLPCLIYIFPIKYLVFQYSTIKTQLKFLNENHYSTIQSLYQYFQDKWVFGNEELMSLFLVMEALEGNLVSHSQINQKHQIIALQMLDTVEYLKLNKINIEMSIYSVWLNQSQIKLSLIALFMNKNNSCPYCEYVDKKNNQEKYHFKSYKSCIFFDLGVFLLETVCENSIDSIVNQQNSEEFKQLYMQLKPQFARALLKSSIHELITVLLSEQGSKRADYSSYKQIIYQNYYQVEDHSFSAKQIMYIQKRIINNKLDVSKILDGRHLILRNIDLCNLVELDLSHNSISNIQFLKKLNLLKLKILNLSHNNISCFDSILAFEEIQKLYLSNNNLNNIDTISRPNFSSLLILLLDNNKIRSIKQLKNVKAPKIKKIWIYNNRIHNLEQQSQSIIAKIPGIDLIY